MGLITRANASMDMIQAKQVLAGNLFAGEALDAGAPCYLKSSDGKVYMSNGTNADEAAEFVGFTPTLYTAGEPVSLFGAGTRFRYGSGLTPGDVYYIAGTKGRLDSAPTTGDTMGVAQAVSSTDILITRVSPVSLAAISDASLTAAKAAVVANANVIGGIPILFRIDCADASADVDVVMTHKVRVIDAWGLNTGIAAHATDDTWQVKNTADAITAAVAKTATVNAVKRIATIDPAKAEIAAGGKLRISTVKATNAAVTVYVLAIRVA